MIVVFQTANVCYVMHFLFWWIFFFNFDPQMMLYLDVYFASITMPDDVCLVHDATLPISNLVFSIL